MESTCVEAVRKMCRVQEKMAIKRLNYTGVLLSLFRTTCSRFFAFCHLCTTNLFGEATPEPNCKLHTECLLQVSSTVSVELAAVN